MANILLTFVVVFATAIASMTMVPPKDTWTQVTVAALWWFSGFTVAVIWR